MTDLSYFDRVRVATATTGTGTVALGSAASGFRNFAGASAPNGCYVEYLIEDGANWEIGVGQYASSGPTMTRSLASSSTGALLVLTGNATVSVCTTARTVGRIFTRLGSVTASLAASVGAGGSGLLVSTTHDLLCLQVKATTLATPNYSFGLYDGNAGDAALLYQASGINSTSYIDSAPFFLTAPTTGTVWLQAYNIDAISTSLTVQLRYMEFLP
jgi:hypothetical protein